MQKIKLCLKFCKNEDWFFKLHLTILKNDSHLFWKKTERLLLLTFGKVHFNLLSKASTNIKETETNSINNVISNKTAPLLLFT